MSFSLPHVILSAAKNLKKTARCKSACCYLEYNYGEATYRFELQVRHQELMFIVFISVCKYAESEFKKQEFLKYFVNN